ncbi:MAG: hypothetical protein ACRDSN_11650, partial [Pseudonocardiaceae bacterium]
MRTALPPVLPAARLARLQPGCPTTTGLPDYDRAARLRPGCPTTTGLPDYDRAADYDRERATGLKLAGD